MGGKGSGGYHGGGRRKKVSNVDYLKENPQDIIDEIVEGLAFLEKRKKEIKEKKDNRYRRWDAVTWLKSHPEDTPMARENLAARESGYAQDDVRQLFAAICLRSCIDYKRATMGERVDHRDPEDVIDECHEFFGDEMFQYFVNRMSVAEVEATIRATPRNAIHSIWKQSENKQQPVKV